MRGDTGAPPALPSRGSKARFAATPVITSEGSEVLGPSATEEAAVEPLARRGAVAGDVLDNFLNYLYLLTHQAQLTE